MTRIYVHPTCTGCKKVQAFLDDHQITYERRDYFGNRFDVTELRALIAEMGITPRDALSTRSRVYQARREEIDQLDDETLLALMTEEPTLIRRPIVISGDTWVIGSRKADLERLASSITKE